MERIIQGKFQLVDFVDWILLKLFTQEGMHSAFTASNGSEKSVPVEKQLPVYQELVRALKAEAKAIKSTRNTQAFINEILEVRFFSQIWLEICFRIECTKKWTPC